MRDGPEDPFDMDRSIDSMAEGAKSMRMLFASYTLAGFTDEQAMQVVCCILNAAVAATGGEKQ